MSVTPCFKPLYVPAKNCLPGNTITIVVSRNSTMSFVRISGTKDNSCGNPIFMLPSITGMTIPPDMSRFLFCCLISSSLSLRSLSSRAFRSTSRDALYPMPSTAAFICSGETREALYSTWAFPRETLTLTDSTPSSFLSTFSTFRAHEAHVMPSTFRFRLSLTTLYPMPSMAFSIS